MAQTDQVSGDAGAAGGPSPVGAAASAGPQRLQTAIRITTPASWVIGAVFAFITVAVIVWGVLGELSTRVGGLGIVLTEGGEVFELRSAAAGTITDMPVAVGDTVTKGQLVARIGQPGRDSELQATWQKIERQQQAYTDRDRDVRKDIADRRAETERQIAVLRQKEATLTQRIAYLSDLLKILVEDRKQQLVTEAQVQQARTELADTRVRLSETRVEISQANLKFLEFEDQRQDELSALRDELEDANGRLETLRLTQQEETVVTATEAGEVVSVEASVGDVLAAGAPIARIDGEGGALHVVGFFEAADGKKIAPGMDVSVSPSTAERALWGTINATVKRVSQFPETLASVNNLLANEQLAEQIFASGPPILVEVELRTNPNTPSGLDWSSGDGPPYRITHGTMAAVSVVVRREAPANLVIPVFWRWVGHGS